MLVGQLHVDHFREGGLPEVFVHSFGGNTIAFHEARAPLLGSLAAGYATGMGQLRRA